MMYSLFNFFLACFPLLKDHLYLEPKNFLEISPFKGNCIEFFAAICVAQTTLEL